MSGLDAEQLDELEQIVSEILEEPWGKETGRPRELTLREALIVTCGYTRNNITEEIWAEIFDVDQSTISRYITFLTPLIDTATAEFRPSAEDAAEATRGAIALVDGTLWPCWSWSGEQALWAGEIQDNRPWLAYHHEPQRPYYLRLRPGSRQSARHGQAEGFRLQDDPESSWRSLRG
jgi:Helix-turn-helix of DDE superfamily endonuclease